MSSGMEDFMALINMRGGINGKIMYKWEECETAYNTARGVECYNRFKDKMSNVHPLSTGITYALIPKGTKDHIVVISSGYGRADASDGRVFPWVFTMPTNYWSQNTAKIKWIAMKQGWDGKDMATIGKYLKGFERSPICTSIFLTARRPNPSWMPWPRSSVLQSGTSLCPGRALTRRPSGWTS